MKIRVGFGLCLLVVLLLVAPRPGVARPFQAEQSVNRPIPGDPLGGFGIARDTAGSGDPEGENERLPRIMIWLPWLGPWSPTTWWSLDLPDGVPTPKTLDREHSPGHHDS